MKNLTSPKLKILVIRRDNIGDLVCTTPIVAALRTRYPDAEICALVNTYNLPVLQNNPDINEVYAYTKAKHRPKGKTVAGVYFDRMMLFAKLRRKHFDYAIIAGAHFIPRALLLARLAKPKHIIGFTEPGKRGVHHIDIGIPYTAPAPMHEVEDIFRLTSVLGVEGPPPPMRVVADPVEMENARAKMRHHGIENPRRIIAVHISARKPSQRWPAENFIAVIRALSKTQDGAAFMLFWSPGDDSNPHHPGDDAKARQIMDALSDLPILGYPTVQLSELIGGLAICDTVICSDGGAMHLAAALGKSILCFFGQSDSSRWHPWGVPYVAIQPESRDVSSITVAETLTAFSSLQQKSCEVV